MGVYWVMENKTETTIMEKRAIKIYVGYIGIMEEKIETTIKCMGA